MSARDESGRAAYKPGDRVTSAHNPAARGTVIAVHRAGGTVSVQWDGYDKSERWGASALHPLAGPGCRP